MYRRQFLVNAGWIDNFGIDPAMEAAAFVSERAFDKLRAVKGECSHTQV